MMILYPNNKPKIHRDKDGRWQKYNLISQKLFPNIFEMLFFFLSGCASFKYKEMYKIDMLMDLKP